MAKGKCTKELVAEAIALKENGASDKDIIAYCGISRESFYRWISSPKTENQSAFSDGLKKAEAKRKLKHIQNINKAADKGTWQASAWYLERRYGAEFAKKDSYRHDSEAGALAKAEKLLSGVPSVI